MMAISATVNISGSFIDTVETSGTTSADVSFTYIDVSGQRKVVSEQKCSLSSAEILTGGKVVVVTGTTDDSGGVTIDPSDTGFRNAAGEEVSLTDVSRILIAGTPGVSARFGTGAVILNAVGGRVAATCCIGAGDKNVKITSLDGTSTYTLLMWQAD
jgi:hypothetical protein